MNHEPLAAVDRLRARGFVDDAQAAHLRRAVRGELVSVRIELQVALWAGITMIAGGAGLLVKENLARLGPLTIGGAITFAAGACLWYVARRAPPFSWQPVSSPTLAYDYVLLLGVLLIGTDLAYLETRFAILGPAWPQHLLVLSLLQLAFAFRYDSRAVLSLGLASFAAWRGLALSLADDVLSGETGEPLRLNALVVGALFVGGGLLLLRSGRKTHFEPAFTNLGLLLALGAAVAGSYVGPGNSATLWGVTLAGLSAATVVLAFRARRSDCFAQGVIAGYLGFLRLVAEAGFSTGILFLASAGSFGVLFLILWAHRRFKEEE